MLAGELEETGPRRIDTLPSLDVLDVSDIPASELEIITLAAGLDLRLRPDLEPHRLHLAEILHLARQMRQGQLISNSFLAAGNLTDEQAIAQQKFLVEFLAQNEQAPLEDKLHYARTHPLRGITLGYADNVASWRQTLNLDARIAGFVQLLQAAGENITVPTPEQQARKIFYTPDLMGPFKSVVRTRDVAYLNRDHQAPAQRGGRLDMAIRKRSTFALDTTPDKLRQQFEVFDDLISAYGPMLGGIDPESATPYNSATLKDQSLEAFYYQII